MMEGSVSEQMMTGQLNADPDPAFDLIADSDLDQTLPAQKVGFL
jgi:hypothetical protein